MANTTYSKSDFIFASKTFLCIELPSEYDQWEYKKLEDFIEENAWQPFENDQATVILDNIETLAEDVRNYIKDKN